MKNIMSNITGSCNDRDDCAESNAECVDRKCKCNDGYEGDAYQNCQRKYPHIQKLLCDGCYFNHVDALA